MLKIISLIVITYLGNIIALLLTVTKFISLCIYVLAIIDLSNGTFQLVNKSSYKLHIELKIQLLDRLFTMDKISCLKQSSTVPNH